MKKYFALLALLFAGSLFAATVNDTVILPKKDGGKVIIAPTNSSGTATELITSDSTNGAIVKGLPLDVQTSGDVSVFKVDPVNGYVTASNPIVTVDYVGTNPEVGGSTPFQLAPNHKRHQIINPAGAITVKLPQTVVVGEGWKITNQSNNIVTIQAYDASYVNQITFGTIELVALQNPADTASGHWRVIRAESQWYSFTPTVSWSTNSSSTATMSRMNDMIGISYAVTLTSSPVEIGSKWSMTLPNSWTLDTTKYVAGANRLNFGSGTYYDSAAGMDIGACSLDDYGSTNNTLIFQVIKTAAASTNVLCSVSQANNCPKAGLTNNDSMTFTCWFPITQFKMNP